jgi:hypothetical protein
MSGQRVTQFLADRAKRDAVDDRAIARLEAHAQMRLADLVGIHQLVRGQCQHRLGIAAAKGSGAVKRCSQFRGHAARANRAVDEDFVDMARLRHVVRQRALHIGPELGESFFAQGHACGHGVAAALHQETIMNSLPHRLAEIDAADRTAGSRADAAGLKRNSEGGTRELVLQP